MLALTLLILAQSADTSNSRVSRVERVPGGRAPGGRIGGFGYAFFEFAPASGAGMGSPCATSNPTGAKGETLTFTRASSATCTRTASGGLATTGIANGDISEVTNNVARVEHDANGVLGLRVEAQGVGLQLRFIDYANAIWSDIGTPTLTGSQPSPFSGTYANAAVQFDDNDAAAYEGRQQTVTVSAGVAHTMQCYVKAGTATSARITLDGTAATITGLSSSTWNIIEVTDASSSGVAIVMQVMVGSATTVTGTVTFGGCDVKTGSYRTSIIPTVAATVTRVAETAVFNTALPASNVGSLAGSLNSTWSTTTSGFPIVTATSTAASPVNSDLFFLNSATSGSTLRCIAGNNAAGLFNTSAVALGAGPQRRGWCATGSTVTGNWNGTDMTVSGATSGSFTAAAYLHIGQAGGSNQIDGIVSRVCRDPDPSRCR